MNLDKPRHDRVWACLFPHFRLTRTLAIHHAGRMPSVTILIPSYKRADLLEKCLHGVCQFAPVGTQILVIDDASANQCISHTAARFPQVEVRRLDQRSGFCQAVNTGLLHVRGEIVELLNDDTEVTPGWVEAALPHFQNPQVAAVAPRVLQLNTRPDQPKIDSVGDGYDVGGYAFKRGHGEPARGQYLQAEPVWGVSGAAGFYRTTSLKEVGGLPHDFGAYFEDVDLAHRLRRSGYEAWYEPGSVVWHWVSSSYGQQPSRRTLMQQSCNEERLFWRNTPAPELFKLLPRHVAVLFGKALRRLGEGTLTPWLFGRLQAARIELLTASRPAEL